MEAIEAAIDPMDLVRNGSGERNLEKVLTRDAGSLWEIGYDKGIGSTGDAGFEKANGQYIRRNHRPNSAMIVFKN